MLGPEGNSLEEIFKAADFSKAEVFLSAEAKGHNQIIDFYYEYWCSKCKNAQLPARKDIRPEELRSYLPYVTLCDLLDESGLYQDFRLIIRLQGTHHAEAYGEMTGRDIAEHTNTGAAKHIYAMSALAREKRALVMSHRRGYAPGREHMDAYSLYMPLSETGETVDKMFIAAEVRMARDAG